MIQQLATVSSRLGDYTVWSADLAAQRVGAALRAAGVAAPRDVAVVTDSNVDALFGAIAREDLAAQGFSLRVNTPISPGEANKSPATVNALHRAWAQVGLHRDALVLALGGGVVSDLAGFASATYARGIEWITVPTTLLAQIDAAIGGKTGVDLPEGKNLVGSFWPPRAVLIDVTALASLPAREIRCGLGELLKYAVLEGDAVFELVTRLRPESFTTADGAARSVIAAAARAKARLCSHDEFDTGDRRLLNLGHTIGHPLETASNYDLAHGEAVAIGLIAEARLAATLGVAPVALAQRISSGCAMLGLATSVVCDPLYLERALAALALDKKRAANQLVFALPVKLGDVRIFGLDRDQHRAAIANALTSVITHPS